MNTNNSKSQSKAYIKKKLTEVEVKYSYFKGKF